MRPHSILQLAACVCMLIAAAEGHGVLQFPAPKLAGNGDPTEYATRMNGDEKVPGVKWNDNPEANTKTFKEQMAKKAMGVDTIKDLINSVVKDCGKTVLDENSPVDVSGKTDLEWKNDYEKKGFVTSHHGPCEVWIDKTKVFQDDDCAGKFAGQYPAKVPVDYSKCSGKCTLEFYWVALHEAKWQFYKNCVKIQNGSGGPAPAPAPAPPAETPAPPKETAAPATEAPAPAKETPAETPTPAKKTPPETPALVPSPVAKKKKAKKQCFVTARRKRRNRSRA